MASTCRPDVVLLDIGLPGMDGYQVAEHLREKPELKNVTIYALTGYTPSDADRERQQQTGFDHHFVKPVSIETLCELFSTIEPSPQ
jgi:CheY-like chemotaxis protein